MAPDNRARLPEHFCKELHRNPITDSTLLIRSIHQQHMKQANRALFFKLHRIRERTSRSLDVATNHGNHKRNIIRLRTEATARNFVSTQHGLHTIK